NRDSGCVRPSKTGRGTSNANPAPPPSTSRYLRARIRSSGSIFAWRHHFAQPRAQAGQLFAVRIPRSGSTLPDQRLTGFLPGLPPRLPVMGSGLRLGLGEVPDTVTVRGLRGAGFGLKPG